MESGQARVPFMPEAEDMTPGQVHVLDRQVEKNVMKIHTRNIFSESPQDCIDCHLYHLPEYACESG